MSGQTAYVDNFGHSAPVDASRLIGRTSRLASQVVLAMQYAGWNWSVAEDDSYGTRRRYVGGANPATGDRIDICWESKPDLRRGWRAWSRYRVLYATTRAGYAPARNCTLTGALAHVQACTPEPAPDPEPTRADEALRDLLATEAAALEPIVTCGRAVWPDCRALVLT